MAARKRTSDQVLLDDRRIIVLLERGFSRSEIVEDINDGRPGEQRVSPPAISHQLARLRREQILAKRQEYLGYLTSCLESTARLEALADAEFLLSKEPAKKETRRSVHRPVHIPAVLDPAGKVLTAAHVELHEEVTKTMTQTQRVGDPRYLKELRELVDLRAKLVGVGDPRIWGAAAQVSLYPADMPDPIELQGLDLGEPAAQAKVISVALTYLQRAQADWATSAAAARGGERLRWAQLQLAGQDKALDLLERAGKTAVAVEKTARVFILPACLPPDAARELLVKMKEAGVLPGVGGRDVGDVVAGAAESAIEA